MLRSSLRDLLSVIIVLVLFIYSAFVVFKTDTVFLTSNYIGYLLVLFSVLLYFVNRNSYIYFLGLVFIIGVVNVVSFTPNNFTFRFGVSVDSDLNSGLSLGFQLISFFLLIIHVWLFKSEFRLLFGISTETNNEQTENLDREEIEKFKKAYKNNSIKELKEISKGKGYRKVASIAAFELLEEKGDE